MKNIQFGFDNGLNPSGSWQGIGINQRIMLLNANYIGSISIDDNNYVVAQDTNNILDNAFVVREALVDLFPDGSYVLYLNQDESKVTSGLETLLREQSSKKEIESIQDVIEICPVARLSIPAFRLVETSPKIIATSILPEIFEEKKNAIKNCHNSFSQLQKENMELYTKK